MDIRVVEEMKGFIIFFLILWFLFSLSGIIVFRIENIKLAQEIINLKADVDNCERRWSRDFSKKHGLIE